MIFNKDANLELALDEFRRYCSEIDKKTEFEELIPDIDNAEFFVREVIGNSVFDLAEAYYHEHYVYGELPTEEASGSGSGSGVSAVVLHRLVERVQNVVARRAAFDYTMTNDVSHAKTGRKAVVDAKNERQAWEFMITRDDDHLSRKMHMAFNRLLALLSANDINGWNSKYQELGTDSVLLNTLSLFERYYQIDGSWLLFMKMIPFMRTVENTHIIPILGTDRYDEIKALLIAKGQISGDMKALIDFTGEAIVLRTIAMAIKRLSVRLLPEGVVQSFQSSIQSRSSSQPAKTADVDSVIVSLRRDAEDAEVKMASTLTKMDTPDYDPSTYDVSTPTNSADNNFFRV